MSGFTDIDVVDVTNGWVTSKKSAKKNYNENLGAVVSKAETFWKFNWTKGFLSFLSKTIF